MTRWALLIEYDGTPFHGWQRQDGVATVQAVLEDAARRLGGGDPVGLTVAGRTDAGVHAEAQVAHLDLERPIAPERLAEALNFHARPHPVVVRKAAAVAADWNARFSALARSYRFVILNRRARPGLLAHRAWHVPHPMDHEAMARAAHSLLGRHDFSSFRAASCQASGPWRTLDRLDVRREGELVVIEAEARSFLHHQVRNMAGTLKLVGCGEWPEARVAQALAARSRAAAGPTAPPDGLSLTGVRYPVDPFEAPLAD